MSLPQITEGKTLQFVADNAYHNSANLDGVALFMEWEQNTTEGIQGKKKMNNREATALGKYGMLNLVHINNPSTTKELLLVKNIYQSTCRQNYVWHGTADKISLERSA